MEAGQGVERREITEKVTMCGRQLNRGNYKEVTAISSLDRWPDPCDFIVIGDGNQTETFSDSCLNNRNGCRGRVSHVMRTGYTVDVEITSEKPGPVIQLKSVPDIHLIPYRVSSADPLTERNKASSPAP